MPLRAFLDRLHRFVAHRPVLLNAALKLQRQTRAVIKYHLTDGPTALTNGEGWLVKRVARPGAVIVDVGANVGNWAALWLDAAPDPAKVLLIEPSPSARTVLVRRFADYPSVAIIAAGAGDLPGILEFHQAAHESEESSFVPGACPVVSGSFPVPVITLDTELPARGLDTVDFLKVDTEGFDLKVMKGARSLFARRAIGIVQFEYNAQWALGGSTLSDALTFLRGNGYEVFLLKSSGLWVLNYERYGEFYSYANLVAFSPSALAQFEVRAQGVL